MFLFLCPESYPDDKYINRCILRSHPVKFFVKKNAHPNSCILEPACKIGKSLKNGNLFSQLAKMYPLQPGVFPRF